MPTLASCPTSWGRYYEASYGCEPDARVANRRNHAQRRISTILRFLRQVRSPTRLHNTGPRLPWISAAMHHRVVKVPCRLDVTAAGLLYATSSRWSCFRPAVPAQPARRLGHRHLRDGRRLVSHLAIAEERRRLGRTRNQDHDHLLQRSQSHSLVCCLVTGHLTTSYTSYWYKLHVLNCWVFLLQFI